MGIGLITQLPVNTKGVANRGAKSRNVIGPGGGFFLWMAAAARDMVDQSCGQWC